MCTEAWRFDPCSVSRSVPLVKSKARSPTFPGIAAPRWRHRNRPAIIRWTITKILVQPENDPLAEPP